MTPPAAQYPPSSPPPEPRWSRGTKRDRGKDNKKRADRDFLWRNGVQLAPFHEPDNRPDTSICGLCSLAVVFSPFLEPGTYERHHQTASEGYLIYKRPQDNITTISTTQPTSTTTGKPTQPAIVGSAMAMSRHTPSATAPVFIPSSSCISTTTQTSPQPSTSTSPSPAPTELAPTELAPASPFLLAPLTHAEQRGWWSDLMATLAAMSLRGAALHEASGHFQTSIEELLLARESVSYFHEAEQLWLRIIEALEGHEGNMEVQYSAKARFHAQAARVGGRGATKKVGILENFFRLNPHLLSRDKVVEDPTRGLGLAGCDEMDGDDTDDSDGEIKIRGTDNGCVESEAAADEDESEDGDGEDEISVSDAGTAVATQSEYAPETSRSDNGFGGDGAEDEWSEGHRRGRSW